MTGEHVVYVYIIFAPGKPKVALSLHFKNALHTCDAHQCSLLEFRRLANVLRWPRSLRLLANMLSCIYVEVRLLAC